MKSFNLISVFISCFPLLCLTNCISSYEKEYPGWKSGEMDIHHIHTGRGEANFIIFPDGTSMLIDAGDWDPKDYPKMCDARPDSSRRAGEWITRYIKRVNPFDNNVDYLMISHFHNDHTGDCTNPAQTTHNRNPNYVLTGIAEVGENIHFKKVFDRGYPDYNYPVFFDDPDLENYRAFIKYKVSQDKLKQERFNVGECNQIKLLKEPEKYNKLFFIQNLCANGEIWNGNDSTTIRLYDLNPANLTNWQNENTKSIGIRISYGAFDYYTGGDLSGLLLNTDNTTIDIEEKVASICGPVDVCKVNHHGYIDAMTSGFIDNIQAQNYIIPVWDREHIQPSVMRRMLSFGQQKSINIYPTDFPPVLREKYKNQEWIKSVCKNEGHVVVKVYDSGRQYKIYVLSSDNEKMEIKECHHYNSKD